MSVSHSRGCLQVLSYVACLQNQSIMIKLVLDLPGAVVLQARIIPEELGLVLKQGRQILSPQ